MTRLEQFQETIDLLEVVISRHEAKYCAAENFKLAFEYCLDVDSGKENNLQLLKQLCSTMPAKEIEGYGQELVSSIYRSYSEMKIMLDEKLNNG